MLALITALLVPAWVRACSQQTLPVAVLVEPRLFLLWRSSARVALNESLLLCGSASRRRNVCAVEFHFLNFNLLVLISVQYRKEVKGILFFGLDIVVLYILFPIFLIASNNLGLATFPTPPCLS